MATHKIKLDLVVKFDDGSYYSLDIPKNVYYYHQQKFEYWIRWIEELMAKRGITARPVRIEEVYRVYETEEYPLIIGM